jgi:hypothetical protein
VPAGLWPLANPGKHRHLLLHIRHPLLKSWSKSEPTTLHTTASVEMGFVLWLLLQAWQSFLSQCFHSTRAAHKVATCCNYWSINNIATLLALQIREQSVMVEETGRM